MPEYHTILHQVNMKATFILPFALASLIAAKPTPSLEALQHAPSQLVRRDDDYNTTCVLNNYARARIDGESLHTHTHALTLSFLCPTSTLHIIVQFRLTTNTRPLTQA